MELRLERSVVVKADGRMIKVVAKLGQLFVCSKGCCCGRVEDGQPAVPLETYQAEWETRRMRNRVQLTEAGCLGPCQLSNVVLLIFQGQAVWFHSINKPSQVNAIFNYIDLLLKLGHAGLPFELHNHIFNGYNWSTQKQKEVY